MLSIIYQYYHNLNGNNNSKASSTCVCLWHMKNNKRVSDGCQTGGFFFSTASARLRLGHVEERRSERAPHTRNKYERAKSPVFKQK